MASHLANLATKYEDPTPIHSSVMSFPLVIIENGYAATAHAPNHVTREYGVKSNYIFWNPRPRFAYSLYNFY